MKGRDLQQQQQQTTTMKNDNITAPNSAKVHIQSLLCTTTAVVRRSCHHGVSPPALLKF
jgi:hypothetical protein